MSDFKVTLKLGIKKKIDVIYLYFKVFNRFSDVKLSKNERPH